MTYTVFGGTLSLTQSINLYRYMLVKWNMPTCMWREEGGETSQMSCTLLQCTRLTWAGYVGRLQLIQDALESQKKVMLLVENEKQLKAQVSLQHIF